MYEKQRANAVVDLFTETADILNSTDLKDIIDHRMFREKIKNCPLSIP